MSSDPDKRPIIIKKIHAAHDDDHGGQWKIAYADFVTAMMAFFLVMWLLSSTTEAQKDGIAQFFNASSVVALPAGNGVLSGGPSMQIAGDSSQQTLTPASDGGLRPDADGGETARDGASAQAAGSSQDGGASRDPIERQRMEAMKAEIERQMGPEGALRDHAQNLRVEMTPDGLRLQIFDRDGAPMFAPGATEPTPRLARILQVIGGVLATVPNAVVLSGHTDGQLFSRGAYGNWELSSDRANAARRVLERDGVQAARMFRVEGKASVEPLMAEAPNDPRNRRIAITVMRADRVAAAAARAPEARR